MAFSLIVVALMGIGLARLTMLALDMPNTVSEGEEAEAARDISRKRRIVHAKMAQMSKPEMLSRKFNHGGAQICFEPVGHSMSAEGIVMKTENYVTDSMRRLFDLLMGSNSFERDEASRNESQFVFEESTLTNNRQGLQGDEAVMSRAESIDPCSICFERASNAVLLQGCNHGGLCYSCAVDICLTSNTCPFCRFKIVQIVIVSPAPASIHPQDNQVFAVVGPYVDKPVTRESAAYDMSRLEHMSSAPLASVLRAA